MRRTPFVWLFAVAVAMLFAGCGTPTGVLATVRERGVLRVGSTGDYKPMSFRNPATGKYEGFDAALAEDLALSLGVRLEFVPTSWPTLMQDTLDRKFDLAICGITITAERQKHALMSVGYLGNGKTVLCRAEDARKYVTLRATRFPFLPPLARFHYPVTFHPWVPLAASAFALRATAGQARLRFTHG